MSKEEIILNIKTDIKTGKTVVDIEVPILTWEKDGSYYVECPLFKTIGYSKKSEKDARNNHDADLKTFFLVHLRRHTLESALYSLGWSKRVKENYQYSDIPTYLLNAQNHTLSVRA